MTKRVSAKREFTRWVGTMKDLIDATRIAETECNSWKSEFQTQARVPLQVLVEELDLGRKRLQDGELKELEDVHDRDLASIQQLRIRVGIVHETPHVYLSLTSEAKNLLGHKTPALRLSVQGSDETKVEGLISRLHGVLAPGGRMISGDAAFLFWTTLLLVLGFLTALTARTPAGSASNVLGVFLIVGFIGAWLGGGRVIRWLFPKLEIHPQDAKPRIQRFRGWVIATLIAIPGSIAANAIWQLLSD